MVSGILAQLSENAIVVVIRLRSLGDTVLTTPALALLKRARPDLRIAIVVERPFDVLLAGNPDTWRVLRMTEKAGWSGLLQAIRQIRRLQPELCLNLHGGATSAWLTALSGARTRAGFGHFRFRFVYNVGIPRAQQVLRRGFDDLVHTAEHHASAVFYLGAPESEIPKGPAPGRTRSPGSPLRGCSCDGVLLHQAVGERAFPSGWCIPAPGARHRADSDCRSGRGIGLGRARRLHVPR